MVEIRTPPLPFAGTDERTVFKSCINFRNFVFFRKLNDGGITFIPRFAYLNRVLFADFYFCYLANALRGNSAKLNVVVAEV